MGGVPKGARCDGSVITARRVVLISDAFRGSLAATRLKEHGFTVAARHDLVQVGTAEQLSEALAGAWAVVAGSERYTAELFERVPTLRVVARPGVGVDAVDVAAASNAGVAIVVTPHANDESVADHTLALMLAGLRRIVELDRSTRAGKWRPDQPGRDLHGATVGVIGLGAIGRAVVRRLHGFGCRILAVEPAPDRPFCDRYAVHVMDLHELLPQVRVVTIHVPLVASTQGLIGASELALLPPDALIVNTARGPIVDEEALVMALQRGALGGAALDVFAREPFGPTDPLAGFSNVTLSPHYAAFTREAIERMVDGTVTNLIDLAANRLPVGCINADWFSQGFRS